MKGLENTTEAELLYSSPCDHWSCYRFQLFLLLDEKMWQLIEYPVFYTSLTYSLLYMPSEHKIFNFIVEDVHLSGPSFSLQSTTLDLPCIYISIFATSNKCIRSIYFHIAERYQRNIISPVWPVFCRKTSPVLVCSGHWAQPPILSPSTSHPPQN